ncbi:MAG: Gfo/Idh/MocA family oxidoreductase [Clostridia bacterium]|nr:Gfo/Idh/MocA family oxidoreductase [Clostridia bacterium]
MDKLKLGVIGFGNMGSSHVRNVVAGKAKLVTITAICDIKEDRRQAAKEEFADIPVFETAEELYKSGLCEAVIIAVPHFDHPSLAIKAFDAGLHVITEKPAGVYTKQVLEMNEAAEKSGKVFGIMYNQRTNPVYAKIRELIQRGELGTIKRVQWTITDWYRCQAYHDSAAWRSTWATEGGGALINQNPHQLDLWQWMFGMPSKIMSFMSFGKYHNIEVEDDVTAYMEYDNGMTGVYITSTGEAPGTNRLEIACDMGTIIVEKNKIHFRRNEISEREFERTRTIPFGKPEVWECEIPVGSNSQPEHMIILDNYAKAVKEGTDMLAPGKEGINGLTISNAMHYSAFTGKWADLKNFPHDEFYELLSEKIKTSKPKTTVKEVVSDTTGTY